MLTELTAQRPSYRPPLSASRMAYIQRLQSEAVRLADEARGLLSVDPRDDHEIAFQIGEITRRAQRLNAILARGPEHG